MLAAARMICASHSAAADHGALASTGILTLSPGSVNTIPGNVKFSLDIRASSDAILDKLEKHLLSDFSYIVSTESTRGLGLSVTWQTDSVSPAIHFHDDCIAAVRASARSVLGNESLAREMISGAGHDSVYASQWCPTSMIFVPSQNGISHNPKEYTTPEDCAMGTKVLLQSVLRFDQKRSGTGGSK